MKAVWGLGSLLPDRVRAGHPAESTAAPSTSCKDDTFLFFDLFYFIFFLSVLFCFLSEEARRRCTTGSRHALIPTEGSYSCEQWKKLHAERAPERWQRARGHSPRTGSRPAATYCGTHALSPLRLWTTRELSPDLLAPKTPARTPPSLPSPPLPFFLPNLLLLLAPNLPQTLLLHAKADTSLSLSAVWWLELRHTDQLVRVCVCVFHIESSARRFPSTAEYSAVPMRAHARSPDSWIQSRSLESPPTPLRSTSGLRVSAAVRRPTAAQKARARRASV